MVGDCEGIVGLALTAADLLLYLAESSLYFPASAIEFDDLLHRQGQVSGHQSDPLATPIYSDHPYRTAQRLEHQYSVIGKDFTTLAVQRDHIGCSPGLIVCGKLARRSELGAVLSGTAFWLSGISRGTHLQ